MTSPIRTGPPGGSPEFRSPDDDAPTPEREQARKRLEAKRRFRGDIVAYVVINAFLVVIWLTTGRGYFWPGWVMGGWAVFLALHGWDVFMRPPITEADADEELRRSRS